MNLEVFNGRLACAFIGMPTFPVDAHKKPLTKKKGNGPNWDATTEEKRILKQCATSRAYGLATGRDSEFFVLDVDTLKGHDKDGLGTLKKLEKKHGRLPRTYTVKTPTGGLHYYFSYPRGRIIPCSTGRLGPGLDVKADRGYVVGPGSRTANGVYRLIDEVGFAKAPEWLLQLVSGDEGEAHTPNGDPKGAIRRVEMAMAVIPNDDIDWESWNRIGLAVYRATEGSSEGYEAFDQWSQKASKYDASVTRERWEAFDKCKPSKIGMGSLVHLANDADPGWERPPLKSFYAYPENHTYIHPKTSRHWPAVTVNTIYGKNASAWLDKHQAVWHKIYAPGEPQLIKGKYFADNEWIEESGATVFNTYRPPRIALGDPAKAKPWINHVKRVFSVSGDAEHIFDWSAHHRQRPEEKLNHALVLGGAYGIGKDTLLAPLRQAVGPWNYHNIKPKDLIRGQFTPHVKSVVLQLDEVHDMGDMNRDALFNQMKTYIAAPPFTLTCNEKFIPAYEALNVCGVVYTTNHIDALFLPHDDRRHYVAWSPLEAAQAPDDAYFTKLWDWYLTQGGFAHVAAFLAQRDLSNFNPKASPRKTEAFYKMVHTHRPVEDSVLSEALSKLDDPAALTLDMLCSTDREARDWISANKKSTAVSNILRRYGYEPLDNPNDKTKGLYLVADKRVRVYVKASLGGREQSAAVASATFKERAASATKSLED